MQGRYLSLQRLQWWPDLTVPLQIPAPLVLEIGFGNGEYLLRHSGERPDVNFLGLELHWGSVRRSLRRLHKEGRDNVRLLHMDAQLALRYLLAPGSLAEFYALYPCPWPKRDHTHHRLFSNSFLGLLARALSPEGKGLVVTDHQEFRDFILAQARNSGLNAVCTTVPAGYDTKYERRWESEGQSQFYEIRFSKDPVFQGPGFQEVQLKAHHVPEMPVNGPQPQGQRGAVVVEFKRRLFDPEEKVYMFLVVAAEDGLTQTFWIEAAYRADAARWVIRPAQGSAVLPTVGVQRALDLVYESCGS
jgi:tRNA (guanine-N7-)-methyltransferase